MTAVSVATFNLYNKVGRWAERQPMVAEQLAELSFDAIALQEVDLIIDQAISLCRLVNARLVDQPRYRVYHMGRPGRAAHIQAIAVMTRLPVQRHEGLDYLSNEGVAQRLRLGLDGGATLDFYNTHLFFPPEATDERRAQGELLLDWTKSWDGANATVIAGDFNAYEGEPVLELMKQRFVSAHETVHGKEPEQTWPTPINDWDPSPPGCLDYIFVEGARVTDAAVALDQPHPFDKTLYPSDHIAVRATLELS